MGTGEIDVSVDKKRFQRFFNRLLGVVAGEQTPQRQVYNVYILPSLLLLPRDRLHV
jgi:hypothetical protein